MKIRFTFNTVMAFLAVLFVCHELHEMAHTALARVQCGCWGERDFNVWETCADCADSVNRLWASLAGPLLTYALIWAGFVLMSKKIAPGYQSLGWILVLANKPFARLFTVLTKSGDESLITRSLLHQERLSVTAWIIEVAIVLLLITPPLVKSWQLMDRNKRTALFISFLLLPMLIEFALLHKLGNSLLQRGILSKPGFFGSPVLVNIWTVTWLTILLLFRKSLDLLRVQKP